MEAENIELGLDGNQENGTNGEEPPTPVDGEAGAAPSEDGQEPQPTSTTSKKKKKKKKGRGISTNQLDADPQPHPLSEPIPDAPPAVDPLADDLAKPIQDLNLETSEVADDNEGVSTPNGAEADTPKDEGSAPTKREKRRAREAAKKAREAEPAQQVRIRRSLRIVCACVTETSLSWQVCNVCAETFDSRSKLFAHIEASGHQLAAPEKGESSQSKKGGAKKGKGKR